MREIDTSLHDRWLQEQLEDPEFRAEFERGQQEIAEAKRKFTEDDSSPAQGQGESS